jgi:hypothetical protein
VTLGDRVAVKVALGVIQAVCVARGVWLGKDVGWGVGLKSAIEQAELKRTTRDRVASHIVRVFVGFIFVLAS